LYRYSPLEALEVPISGQKLKCDRLQKFRIVKLEFPLAEYCDPGLRWRQTPIRGVPN